LLKGTPSQQTARRKSPRRTSQFIKSIPLDFTSRLPIARTPGETPQEKIPKKRKPRDNHINKLAKEKPQICKKKNKKK
jgi:hypothetical protein